MSRPALPRHGALTQLLRVALGASLLAAPACETSRSTAVVPSPRIVSLHDVTSEILVALGAVEHLVGRSAVVDLPDDVVRALDAVPELGSSEAILAAKPDLVVGLGVVAERSPELVQVLARHGVSVTLADPATVADLLQLITDLAAQVGARERGEALLASVRGALPSAAVGPVKRVFVYDCCDPPFTAGGRTLLTDLIHHAGGRNIFADLEQDWTHVSWEDVVVRSPELVIVHAYDYEGQGDVATKRVNLGQISGLAKTPTVVLPLRLSLGGLGAIEALPRLRAAIGELRP